MKRLDRGVMISCISSIVLGIVLVNLFHSQYVSPIDEAREILLQMQAKSDPQAIHNELVTVKGLLPPSVNPTWAYPTQGTEFGLMHKDLQSMLATVDGISYDQSSSSDFHKGVLNVHAKATMLVFDMLDLTPYIYSTPPFILANSLWLFGVIGLAGVSSIGKK